VLELCAGAGQIGLLAVAEGDRELVLVDLDPAACAHAHSNARRVGLADRVVVRQAALHEAVEPGERFAVVIADPPWVSGAVGRFPEDPLLAIDGGPDGLATAWTCLEVAAAHLVGGGSAVVQLGSEAQVAAVRDRLDDGSLGLEFAESRAYGTSGMLVHLRRAGRADQGF
jgi:release factor glutamine methyltransferase